MGGELSAIQFLQSKITHGVFRNGRFYYARAAGRNAELDLALRNSPKLDLRKGSCGGDRTFSPKPTVFHSSAARLIRTLLITITDSLRNWSGIAKIGASPNPLRIGVLRRSKLSWILTEF